MKLVKIGITSCLLMLAVPGHAGQGNMISRGGVGYLFPDHNSFSNIGQNSLDKGTSIEASYSMTPSTVDGGSSTQDARPSVMFSNGMVALGVFGDRSGTSLTDASQKTDSIGAGIGIALAKQRLTLGIEGERSIDVNQVNDGTVRAGLNWNGDKGKGLALGVGASTTLNEAGGEVRKGTAALGWAFKEMTKVEFVAQFNDLSNFSDYDLGGYFTVQGKVLYVSGGYNYLMLNKESEVRGRLGLTLGNSFDVSGFVDYTITTGNKPTFGGTVRLSF